MPDRDTPITLSTGRTIERERLTCDTPRGLRWPIDKAEDGSARWAEIDLVRREARHVGFTGAGIVGTLGDYDAIVAALECVPPRAHYPPSLAERRIWGVIQGEGPLGEPWEMWTVVGRDDTVQREEDEDNSLIGAIASGVYYDDYGQFVFDEDGDTVAARDDRDDRETRIEVSQSPEELREAFGVRGQSIQDVLYREATYREELGLPRLNEQERNRIEEAFLRGANIGYGQGVLELWLEGNGRNHR